MTRDEILGEALENNNPKLLLELSTGVGKSRIAIEIIKQRLRVEDNPKIFIIIPKLVLIQNWKDEFIKWEAEKYLPFIKFITYVSYPKYSDEVDMVIFDEVQHFSERCAYSTFQYKFKNVLMLSATVGRDVRFRLKECFRGYDTIKVDLRQSIENEILPDPKVILIPMMLKNSYRDCELVINKKATVEIRDTYDKRWLYKKNRALYKNKKIVLSCSEAEYYEDTISLINWHRNQVYDWRNQNDIHVNQVKVQTLNLMKWLSNEKTQFLQRLLMILKDYRCLTFCNSIEQTEQVCKFNISSKNAKSMEYLEMFNQEKIKHISSVSLLDEGCNLSRCRIGIFGMLNKSERLVFQRVGRILRHPKPIIIIPYFRNTIDEDIVKEMCTHYNPELIYRCTDIDKLKEIINQ